MSIINSQPLIGASGNQGGYTIAKSLRLRSSASAYLSRTPGSTGDRQKWTWSGWVKRGTIGTGTYKQIFQAGSGTSRDSFFFDIDSPDTLMWFGDSGGYGALYGVRSAAVFRDPAAWYHIIWAADTTQATASNRLKLYVNGVQQTLSTAVGSGFLPQNTSMYVNNTTLHTISSNAGSSEYFDGYITDVNFIGGQQLTPSSFGETDSITGVWKPKAYSGTYGTNGFYLKFADATSTSTLGNDSSGNGNTWTTNNISVTAGATYDSMTDVPTLTSATAANYAVANPLDKQSDVVVSDGNLKISLGTVTGAIRKTNASMALPTTGKYYWESKNIGSTNFNMFLGIQTYTASLTTIGTNDIFYNEAGEIQNNGTSSGAIYATLTTGDIVGIAYDADANKIYFYKNNTIQNSSGTTPSFSGPYIPFFGMFSTNNAQEINFGQRPFAYTPPTGFKALNTYNLPDSTIVAGNKVMDATTYTSNGTTQTVTNAGGFKPDLVWQKTRSVIGSNWLTDSVRGAALNLNSNNTNAETSLPLFITSFNSNGFGIGTDNFSGGTTLVGWQWQAGQGSTSSNTNGSITSTVSVNASAGFSIVTYTGNGSTGTVGHGLGVAPKFIIVKNRGATSDWATWSSSLSSGNYILLNSTAAQSNSSAVNVFGNNTITVDPTSSVFTVGNGYYVNSTSTNYVAYCWSEVAGFSKFGSYTGNGSTDGPFIYLGFIPKFWMAKRTDVGAPWLIYDSSRNTSNVVNNYLQPSANDAEGSGSSPNDVNDFLSNGFKIRCSNLGENANGGTFIYMAFAENPFKNSLAR